MPNPDPWPCLSLPNGCPCRCHNMRRGIQKGKNTRDRRVKRRTDWRPEEINLCLSLVKQGISPEEISDRLFDYFGGRRRTPRAIRNMAVQNNLSARDGWYSENDIRSMLGVNIFRVRAWRSSGELPMRRHRRADTGEETSWWRCEAADFEKFVDTQAGILFTVAIVKDPKVKARAEFAVRKRESVSRKSST